MLERHQARHENLHPVRIKINRRAFRISRHNHAAAVLLMLDVLPIGKGSQNVSPVRIFILRTCHGPSSAIARQNINSSDKR